MNRGIRHPPNKRHDFGESRHRLSRSAQHTLIERRIPGCLVAAEERFARAPLAVLSEPPDVEAGDSEDVHLQAGALASKRPSESAAGSATRRSTRSSGRTATASPDRRANIRSQRMVIGPRAAPAAQHRFSGAAFGTRAPSSLRQPAVLPLPGAQACTDPPARAARGAQACA